MTPTERKVDALEVIRSLLTDAAITRMYDTDAEEKHNEAEAAIAAMAELVVERNRLHALVNNPLTENFLEAVRAEVAHQVERWGTVHDRAKEPADWFWLVGYLAGKALAAHVAGDEHKALHHTISTAAVLANWHTHIRLTNGGTFTPGSSDLQRFLQETFGSAFADGEQA